MIGLSAFTKSSIECKHNKTGYSKKLIKFNL